MPKNDEKNQQEEKKVPMRDEMHLDDFLNHMESEGKRELLSAFAHAKKKVNEFKKTFEEWIADFRKFENQIPE